MFEPRPGLWVKKRNDLSLFERELLQRNSLIKMKIPMVTLFWQFKAWVICEICLKSLYFQSFSRKKVKFQFKKILVTWRGGKEIRRHNIIIIATPCTTSLPSLTPPPQAALSSLSVKHTLSLKVYHGNHSICPKQTQRHSCSEIKATCLIKGSTCWLCMVLIQQWEIPSWWNFLRTKIYSVNIHLIFIWHVYNKCAKYTLFYVLLKYCHSCILAMIYGT